MDYKLTIKYVLQEGKPFNSFSPVNHILTTVPETVKTGDTLCLTTDGMYFTFKKTDWGQVSGAAISRSLLNNKKTLEIVFTEVTSEVEIILNLTSAGILFPQTVSKPFFLNEQPYPIDTRLVLSKAEMKTANDNHLPPVYFASCLDDGKFYLYNKSNDSNEETGKYKQLATEGITDLDRLDEEDITGILKNLNLD